MYSRRQQWPLQLSISTIRKIPVILATVAIAIGTQGCQQAAVAVAVQSATGIAGTMSRSKNSDAVPGRGVIAPRPGSWQRRFQTVTEKPLSRDTYQDGDSVLVTWGTNVGVGKDGLTIGILEESACAATRQGPSRVSAKFAADSRVRAEVWKVGRPGSWNGEAVPAGKTLGLFGEGVIPSYLILTPQKGDYYLEMTWAGTDIEELGRIAPCVFGWAATASPEAVASTSATTTSPAQGLATTREPSAEMEPAAFLESSPEVTLVQLHDDALNLEFGNAEIDVNKAVAQRTLAIEKMLGSAEGRKMLCRITQKYRLDARDLALWRGQPTVTTAWKQAAGCGQKSAHDAQAK